MIIHPAVDKGKLNCYTYATGETATGNLVDFTCASENVDKVKEMLKLVCTIDRPITHKVNVEHGGYGKYSRFDIQQHKYGGGHGGYMEVLEIKDPSDNRHNVVLHWYSSAESQSKFIEFDTVDNAIKSWDKWNSFHNAEEIKKVAGFIRLVECGWFEPWFYAVGDQHLSGDFVVPDIFAEHPYFRVDKKFIVTTDGYDEIKTCVGAIVEEKSRDSYIYSSSKKYKQTTVYWDDGTTTVVCDDDSSPNIKPLKSDKLWITQAISKFNESLSGKIKKFEIPFIDGSKFIGAFTLPYHSMTREGNYRVCVVVEKDGETKEVRADNLKFVPTEKCKTILQKLENDCTKANHKLVKVKSCKRIGYSCKEKQWEGVFSYDAETYL